MLKFLFWSLVCANLALLAFGQGYLGNFSANEREPARIANQLNAQRIKLIAPQAGAAGKAASLPAPAPSKPGLIACTEIGIFPGPDAARFEQAIAALGLGERQTRRDVAVMEVNTHIVHIPPFDSKDAADRKAAELTRLGVSNYVITDNTSLRWAISLGVFKSEAAARNLLAALSKQGIEGAKIAGRGPSSTQVALQFRDIDRATRARLDQIRAAFPAQDSRSCKR